MAKDRHGTQELPPRPECVERQRSWDGLSPEQRERLKADEHAEALVEDARRKALQSINQLNRERADEREANRRRAYEGDLDAMRKEWDYAEAEKDAEFSARVVAQHAEESRRKRDREQRQRAARQPRTREGHQSLASAARELVGEKPTANRRDFQKKYPGLAAAKSESSIVQALAKARSRAGNAQK